MLNLNECMEFYFKKIETSLNFAVENVGFMIVLSFFHFDLTAMKRFTKSFSFLARAPNYYDKLVKKKNKNFNLVQKI